MGEAANSAVRDENDRGPDPELQRLAVQFHRLGRRLYLATLPLPLLVVVGLWATGFSLWLDRTTQASAGGFWLGLIFFLCVLGVLLTLLGTPLRFVRGYVIPHRYGLVRQTVAGWFADYVKGLLLGGLLGLAALAGTYWLIRHTGGEWWWIAGLCAFALSVAIGAAAPVLIAPLFFRFTPLPDGEFATRLWQLAERSHVRVRGIYRFDMSSKVAGANAAVFGFGPTRRIIVADSMLDSYPPEGVEAVVGHELGHHVHGDLWILSISNGLVTLLGLWAVNLFFTAGPYSHDRGLLARPGGLPLFLLCLGVVTELCNPFLLALSRWAERRADVFAARLTGEQRWLRRALIRLLDENLAELDPPRWEVLLRFSHPPMRERLTDLSG